MQTLQTRVKNKTTKEKVKRFIDRNRLNLGISLSVLIQLSIIFFWQTPKLDMDKLDHLVEEVAFIDSVSIKEDAIANESVDGDIELVDKKKENEKQQEDPRITSAIDAMISGATEPIDLSPHIKPEYTEEARMEGVTGTLTLEVIISESGEVLQAKSVGRQLGFGLEQSAIKTYRKKKFAPSFLDGKSITVKVLIPIRFTLN